MRRACVLGAGAAGGSVRSVRAAPHPCLSSSASHPSQCQRASEPGRPARWRRAMWRPAECALRVVELGVLGKLGILARVVCISDFVCFCEWPICISSRGTWHTTCTHMLVIRPCIRPFCLHQTQTCAFRRSHSLLPLSPATCNTFIKYHVDLARCCECTVRTPCQSQGLVSADQRLLLAEAGRGLLVGASLPKPDPRCCPGALLALISCGLALDLASASASADELPGDKSDKVLETLSTPGPAPLASLPPTSACPLAPSPWACR